MHRKADKPAPVASADHGAEDDAAAVQFAIGAVPHQRLFRLLGAGLLVLLLAAGLYFEQLARRIDHSIAEVEALNLQLRDTLPADAALAARLADVQSEHHALHIEQSLAISLTLIVIAFVSITAMLLGGWHFEALRRQAQLTAELIRSRRRSDEKSAFLAHVSHEIRTPMNAIFGFSSMLQDRLRDPGDRRHIDAITCSARALLAILNDLLDFSAIEAGRIGLVRKPTDLRDIVDGIESMFAQQAAGKGLALKVGVDDGLPRALMLDGDRVRQMLINLVGNAIKYTPSGHVRLQVRGRPGRLPGCVTCELTVTDSGPGIEPARQQAIFEPFVRGRAVGDVGGSGLGLTITRRLARAMGGDVGLVSQPGRGSAFTCTLPDVAVAERAPGHARDPQPAGPPPAGAADGAATEAPGPIDPRLAGDLRGLMERRWRTVCETLTISEVRDFAMQVIRCGEHHRAPQVQHYGHGLLTAASSFDVVRMETLLAAFPAQVAAAGEGHPA